MSQNMIYCINQHLSSFLSVYSVAEALEHAAVTPILNLCSQLDPHITLGLWCDLK